VLLKLWKEREMERKEEYWPGDPELMDADDPRRGYVGDPPGWREQEKDEGVIRFTASVWKVSTLADKGLRLVLDLPETAIPQMAMLAECKRQNMALAFEAKESD
jgi:hypothetical protein